MSQWGIRPILTNGGAEVKGENASSRTTTTPTRPKPPDPSTPKVVSRINLFNPFKSFNFGCDASRLGFVRARPCPSVFVRVCPCLSVSSSLDSLAGAPSAPTHPHRTVDCPASRAPPLGRHVPYREHPLGPAADAAAPAQAISLRSVKPTLQTRLSPATSRLTPSPENLAQPMRAKRHEVVNDLKRRQYDASGGMRAQSPTAGSKGSRAGPPHP